MNPIITMPAFQLSELIKTKKLSSVEVVQAFIDRINQVNPAINAIHNVNAEKILANAKQADLLVKQGGRLGRLHGVPISIKDSMFVPGIKGSRGNTHIYKNATTDKSATVVQRLLDEGAIILGTTNVPEFLSAFESDNLIYGRTNNPYNLALTPGGSSGGEAAIICAGGSPLGVGSDAGGSIRVPAHYCGISGFKPSRGVIPGTGNIPGDFFGLFKLLAVYGPMARHVEDLILAFSIMAGPDGMDSDVVPMHFPDPQTINVKSLKVAYFKDNGIAAPSTDIQAAIDQLIPKIANHVQSITEARPPHLEQTYKLVWETFFLGGDKGALLDEMLAALGQTEFSPLFETFLPRVRNSDFTLTEFKKRFAEIDKYRTEIYRFMQDYDILICPVTATTAREHGTTHAHADEFTYAMTFNITGWPVVTIPCGLSAEGLPIGIQIVAKPWHDHVALAAALAIQKLIGVLPIPSMVASGEKV